MPWPPSCIKRLLTLINIFHRIPNVTLTDRNNICLGAGKEKLSTVIKHMNLDGWVQYCDGSIAETHTTAGIPNPHFTQKPTTSKPISTSKVTSTTKPISTSKVTLTTKPVSTSKVTLTTKTISTSKSATTTGPPATTSIPGGGNGCTSKHWDQCGGNDWKGCTVCAVRLAFFGSTHIPYIFPVRFQLKANLYVSGWFYM